MAAENRFQTPIHNNMNSDIDTRYSTNCLLIYTSNLQKTKDASTYL